MLEMQANPSSKTSLKGTCKLLVSKHPSLSTALPSLPFTPLHFLPLSSSVWDWQESAPRTMLSCLMPGSHWLLSTLTLTTHTMQKVKRTLLCSDGISTLSASTNEWNAPLTSHCFPPSSSHPVTLPLLLSPYTGSNYWRNRYDRLPAVTFHRSTT